MIPQFNPNILSLYSRIENLPLLLREPLLWVLRDKSTFYKKIST